MSAVPDIQFRTLYDQVTDEFVRRVISGEWPKGEVIRNEADLAKELGVSLGTVRKAFLALTALQLIVRVPGKGTTVVDPFTTRESHRFIHTRTHGGSLVLGELVVSEPCRVEASPEMASVFRSCVGSPLIRFERLRIHRDRVFTTETVHIPVVRNDTMSIDERARHLWFDHDVTVDKVERIDSAFAPERDCDIFEVDARTPLFRSERVIYGYRSKVLEHRIGHIHLGCDLRFVMGPHDAEN